MSSPYRESSKRSVEITPEIQEYQKDLRCLVLNREGIIDYMNQKDYPVEVTREDRLLGVFCSPEEINNRISDLKDLVGE